MTSFSPQSRIRLGSILWRSDDFFSLGFVLKIYDENAAFTSLGFRNFFFFLVDAI